MSITAVVILVRTGIGVSGACIAANLKVGELVMVGTGKGVGVRITTLSGRPVGVRWSGVINRDSGKGVGVMSFFRVITGSPTGNIFSPDFGCGVSARGVDVAKCRLT